MARKTVSVFELLDWANHELQSQVYSADNYADKAEAFRAGIAHAIEQVLHTADAYEGFRYLVEFEVPANQKPGIVTGCTPAQFPDETRRQYFYHRKIR